MPGLHYPVLYHIVAIFSNITGITTYDTLILIAILFLLGTSLCVYLIIRKFNKHIAIISLPVMVMASYGKFSLSITFGQHGLITGGFFLVAFLWVLSSFRLEKVFLIFIFLSATMLGHAPEFVFGMIFLALYVLILLLNGRLQISVIKRLIVIGVLTFITTIYYFIILKGTWIAKGFSKLEIITLTKFLEGKAFPPILFNQDFNILLLIAFYIGALLGGYFMIQKKSIPLTVLFFLVLLGFSNYFGYGHKAFQQRFLWPIYIAGFFGLTVYSGFRLIIKKTSLIYSFIMFLVLSSTIVLAYAGKTKPGSMMDSYHWDSFVWIQKNIPKESIVFFFYQDITTQHSLYYASTQHKTYVIDLEPLINAIKNKEIMRNYDMVISAEAGASLPYRKSLFSFGYHGDEEPKVMFNSFDICSMEYLVFDKLSGQQVFAEYNKLIMEELKKNNWIQDVYSNQVVSVLKNNKQGEKCIDERQF